MNGYKKTQYTIYENDTPVFVGTSREISEKFGVPTNSLGSYYRRGTLMFRKYRVIKTGESEVRQKPKPKPKKTKEEETLEYLARHLKQEGNVSFSNENEMKRLDLYLEKLKEMGLEAKARKVLDDYDPTMPNIWKKDKSYFYILELANAKRRSQSV